MRRLALILRDAGEVGDLAQAAFARVDPRTCYVYAGIQNRRDVDLWGP